MILCIALGTAVLLLVIIGINSKLLVSTFNEVILLTEQIEIGKEYRHIFILILNFKFKIPRQIINS